MLEGEVANFEAIVNGIPFPEITWSKDGSPLKSISNMTFAKKDGCVSCNITKSSRTDAGLYQLTCSNASGSVECSARLTVNGRSN